MAMRMADWLVRPKTSIHEMREVHFPNSTFESQHKKTTLKETYLMMRLG